MHRYLLSAAIMMAALVLYGFGMTGGGIALFVAGVVCELWFWIRARQHVKSIWMGIGTPKERHSTGQTGD
jgi:hypothetical protein